MEILFFLMVFFILRAVGRPLLFVYVRSYLHPFFFFCFAGVECTVLFSWLGHFFGSE